MRRVSNIAMNKHIPYFGYGLISLFHLLVLLVLQDFYFLATWTWSNTHIVCPLIKWNGLFDFLG
jgi:hypothetical protein